MQQYDVLQNRLHPRVSALGDEASDPLLKLGMGETCSEDFVLAKDHEENSNRDAQRRERRGISVILDRHLSMLNLGQAAIDTNLAPVYEAGVVAGEK